MGFGTLLNCLGIAEEQTEYIDQALIEFAAAGFHFEQLGHAQQCGRVENNLGFLYLTIGKFPEAHTHINRARTIFVSLSDQGLTAQVDDTRARTFLAEGRFLEAERYARFLEGGAAACAALQRPSAGGASASPASPLERALLHACDGHEIADARRRDAKD